MQTIVRVQWYVIDRIICFVIDKEKQSKFSIQNIQNEFFLLSKVKRKFNCFKTKATATTK